MKDGTQRMLVQFLCRRLSPCPFFAPVSHEAGLSPRENRPLRQEPRGTRPERCHTPGPRICPPAQICSFRRGRPPRWSKDHSTLSTQGLRFPSTQVHLQLGKSVCHTWARVWPHPGGGSARGHLTSWRGLCTKKLVGEEEEEGGKKIPSFLKKCPRLDL